MTALMNAINKNNLSLVEQLIQNGADVRAVDPGMKATALHAAAYAGRTEAAKLLIEYNIDINKQGPYNGYTALHDAIWQDNVDIVKLLLAANADLNLLSHDGKSPLDFAKSKNCKEIIPLIQTKLGK